MKKKSEGDMPIGKVQRIKDVLPPPDQLQMPEETVKVTIALSQGSVAFFKKQARKHGTKYQKMIRTVLDHYADHYRAA